MWVNRKAPRQSSSRASTEAEKARVDKLVAVHGQELSPRNYAICKADLLINNALGLNSTTALSPAALECHFGAAGSSALLALQPRLLANVYLHDFDRTFHGADGPAQFANARLVRYADDFVVLARWMGARVIAWLERTLEQDLRLTVNRTKTQVVRMHSARTSLTFLGFTLRYDRDRTGRPRRYLNVVPARVREKLRGLTDGKTKRPLAETIGAVNTLLRGWAAFTAHRAILERAFPSKQAPEAPARHESAQVADCAGSDRRSASRAGTARHQESGGGGPEPARSFEGGKARAKTLILAWSP